MQYVILDLEWNGSYSKKAHGYFNEIIEVGAIKLDENLAVIGEFQEEIHPVVSKKLSSIVTNLTNITPEELEDGTTFAKMMKRFARFLGNEPTAVLTWSTTDLLVLMENCRFFYGRQEVPAVKYYMDFQAYAQQRIKTEDGQQLGLSKAGELLSIPQDALSLHRALDDSRLTVHILQKVADAASLEAAVQTVNEEFYRRITYKVTVVSDIHDPLVQRGDFSFVCPQCGEKLKQKTSFRFHNRAFCAEMRCHACKKSYIARVQYRRKYEGTEVRRKLTEKVEKPPEPSPKAETDP